MAFDAGKVITKFIADTTSYESGRKQVERGSKETSNSIMKGFLKAEVVMKAVTGAIELMGKGFQSAIRFVGSASQSALDYQRNLTTLGIIAERYGVSQDKATLAARELGEELRIGVGPAAESLQRLFKGGLNLEQAKELLKRFTNEALTGKSSAMGLGEAVMNLSMMYQTEMSMLGDRAGISENVSTLLKKEADIRGVQISQLDEASRNQLKYNAFIRLTNETLGSSEKFMGTLIDSQAIYQNWWERIRVTVGEGVNPILNFLYKNVLIPIAQTIQTRVVPAVQKFAFLLQTLVMGVPKTEKEFKKFGERGKEIFGEGGVFGTKAFSIIINLRNAIGDFAKIVMETVSPAIEEIKNAFNETTGIVTETVGAFVETQAEGEKGGSVIQTMGKIVGKTIASFIRFGANFLKITKSVFEWINNNRDAIVEFIDKVMNLVGTIASWIKENQEILKTIIKVTAIVLGLVAAVKIVIGVIGAIGAVITVITGPIGILIALIALLSVAWTKNWGGIREKVTAFVEYLRNVIFPVIQKVISLISNVIIWLVNNIIGPYMAKAVAGFKILSSIVSWLWKNIISPAFNAISKIITWLLVNIIIPFISRFIQNIRILANIFSWLYNNIISPVVKLITSVILRHFTNIFNFLKLVFSGIVNSAKIAWSLIRTYIINPIQSAWNAIMTRTEGIRKSIKDKFDRIVEFLRNLKDKIVNAIINPFKDAKSKIEGIAEGIKSIADKINPFHKESPSLVENVKRGISQIIDSYKGLSSISLPAVNTAGLSIGNTLMSTKQTGMIGGEEMRRGAGQVNNYFNIKDYYGDMMGVRSLAQRITSEQRKIKKAYGT